MAFSPRERHTSRGGKMMQHGGKILAGGKCLIDLYPIETPKVRMECRVLTEDEVF